MAKRSWKSWHEVVSLREELKSGELALHMFAADLYEVLLQRGKRPIYEEREKFFALTYPTFNLRALVRDVALRLAGKNDKAVRQLTLNYGGGKTHTLITLRHLVTDPKTLPATTAVEQFRAEIGEDPPEARVAGLCFDKLDVEKGMEVLSPAGEIRNLKQPWSVLAWQLAGEDGLRLLHPEDRAEERESAPAENLLTQLLEIPPGEGLGVLILIDEVLMYVREKIASDPGWKNRMLNFFQYLTQAAAKVDRCCVVASILASDPARNDNVGRQLQGQIYDIFQRQREEAVEPVEERDIAEVLRRRFFTPESIADQDAFRPHVQAALKGVYEFDEQSKRQGAESEKRFLESYPFHPDLTKVFYSKWTAMSSFQKTRGVLRTFALALREAEKWDESAVVGPAVFLSAPENEGLSESMRELVTVADTQDPEGGQQAWTGILTGEFSRGREIQQNIVGLVGREIEQAVVSAFLHSQPQGQTMQTRDLLLLLGPSRPDRIELEKGLREWARVSFWLDDRYTSGPDGQLPETWRLGNRPNLRQMHTVASQGISDEIVRTRLLSEIGKAKSLTQGASGSSVQVHTLPSKPKDVPDDGRFRYVILGPSAASSSGKPSSEAVRYLDETTNSDKPRVYRNSILLLVPSREGLDAAYSGVRDYLAWEQVGEELKEQEKEGSVDVARQQSLAIERNKAEKRIPEAIRQAYSTVVTVSEKNEPQAFKINLTDEPHFATIKADPRSRIEDTSITAEAILPEGPYDLWKDGETQRRVKDLSMAFAQFPHLPKMLRSEAITDTLVDGCRRGSFVLRLERPDHSVRTWWYTAPDDLALKDPALELVLTEAAELVEIDPQLLKPNILPGLWKSDVVTVAEVVAYFDGTTVVQVDRDGFPEPQQIPKAEEATVHAAVASAVKAGELWLRSDPTSVLEEPIPAGVLNNSAQLREPPGGFAATEILPEALPEAWQDSVTTAQAILSALNQRFGGPLPWKTVGDVITAAINARFLELDPLSESWPAPYTSAAMVKLKVSSVGASGRTGDGATEARETAGLVAEAELSSNEIQDLADEIPKILNVVNRRNVPIAFAIRIQVGDEEIKPDNETVSELNSLLEDINPSLGFKP
ncbi:MAG: DUF499 domain-containing protein [Spirochaetaceae bacterium]